MCLKHIMYNGPLAYHWLPSSSRAGIEGRAPQIIYFNFHVISYRICQCNNSKIGYLRVTFTFRLIECTREKILTYLRTRSGVVEHNFCWDGGQSLKIMFLSSFSQFEPSSRRIPSLILMGCAMCLLQCFNQIQYSPGSRSCNRDLHIRSRSLPAVQVQSGNFSSFNRTIEHWDSCFIRFKIVFLEKWGSFQASRSTEVD